MDLSQIDTVSVKAHVTDKLSAAIRGFLEASVEVWPQDALLKALHTTVKTLDDADLCDSFAKVFDKQALMKAQDRDASLWSLDVFSAYEAESKQASANSDIRDAVWEHLKAIADSGLMQAVYTSVPTGILDKVQDISKNISEKVKSGEMNLKDLNPLTMGSMVMSQISPDDMQKLSSQVMGFMNSDPQNMFRLLNSMQSMMPAGAPQMPQMGELSALLGNLDIASLMKNFGPK